MAETITVAVPGSEFIRIMNRFRKHLMVTKPEDIWYNTHTTIKGDHTGRVPRALFFWDAVMTSTTIAGECATLRSQKTRGDLGAAVAGIVLSYSSRDLQRMRWNFSSSIQDISPEYRKRLEETITGHLHGTYQNLRLMEWQGTFSSMSELVPDHEREYWTMVASQCSGNEREETRLRFLKFLLAGFCIFVQQMPGHPVGMPFPGGDEVEFIDGIYYCPVREKAYNVDAALCPFCPARQTPAIGYLRSSLNASERRKREFIRNCYTYHNFNG